MQWFRRPALFFVIALVLCSAALLLGQCVPTQNEKSGVPNSQNEKPQVPGQNGVRMPACSYTPAPPYTKEARAAKYEGDIRAEALVGLDGRVTNVRVIKSPGLGMDESVTNTLKKWKCKPGKDRDGKPVPTLVPFQFTLRLDRASD